MLPGVYQADGTSTMDKGCYTDSDKPEYAFGKTALNTAAVNEYIRNPHCCNTGSGMDGQYYNLWSADNTLTTVNNERSSRQFRSVARRVLRSAVGRVHGISI